MFRSYFGRMPPGLVINSPALGRNPSCAKLLRQRRTRNDRLRRYLTRSTVLWLHHTALKVKYATRLAHTWSYFVHATTVLRNTPCTFMPGKSDQSVKAIFYSIYTSFKPKIEVLTLQFHTFIYFKRNPEPIPSRKGESWAVKITWFMKFHIFFIITNSTWV